MSIRRSSGPARLTLAAALALLTACESGPTSPNGTGRTAQLALAITLQAEEGGGEGDAYDAANIVRIRLRSGGTVLFDQTASFTPAAETRVPIAVQVQNESAADLDVTLLRDLSPLFTGSASLTLVPNEVVAADLTLVPVAASISVPESLPALASLGETALLPGDVRFATGDVASSLHLQWTSLTPEIVSVQTSGTSSSVVALRSGRGVLKAAFPPFEANVVVEVDIVAESVDVQPAEATIGLGETLQLTATPVDALGNPVAGVEVAWSSSDEEVATVDGGGLVLGLRGGTVTISATGGDAVGTASIEVVAPPPTVGTDPAMDVRVASATLRGTVNPNRSPTTAWFELGTVADLASFTETTHEDVGSGAESRAVSAELGDLSASTTYYFRIVAANDGGREEGPIESFTTLTLAPPVAETLEPTEVRSTSATLAGSVDPRGAVTTSWFEWGVDLTLATYSETPRVEIGSGVGPQVVEADLRELSPEGGLYYYYRVVAENASGTVRGEILQFRTAPLPPTGLSGGFDGYILYLNWADNSLSETSFQIERSAAGPSSGFVGVGSVSGSSAPYAFWDDDGPFPAPTLYYRVRACNGSTCSEPSNVVAIGVPPPSIIGRTFLCYSPGTSDCYGYGTEVTLIGGAKPIATFSDEGGFYSFGAIPVGSYTLSVKDDVCVDFRANERSITVGWGEEATVDFYADYDDPCAGELELAASPDSLDPVARALLGLEADGARATGLSPR